MGIDEWVDNWHHLGIDKFLVIIIVIVVSCDHVRHRESKVEQDERCKEFSMGGWVCQIK